MSDKILKLSQAQTLYEDLRGRIDALPTDSDIPDVPVQDVQVNGTSILNQGVANVPLMSNSSPGVAKFDASLGTTISSGGAVIINAGTDTQIKDGINGYRPIVPLRQHASTFYGLAKAAGADMASLSSATVGVYPDAQKAAIQNMLGITDLISTEESSTATAAHAINSTFMMGGKLYRATAAIAIGDAVEVGTNCEVVKADEVFVKNTDYASANNFGITSAGAGLRISNSTNKMIIDYAGSNKIKLGTEAYNPIVPYVQHEAVYFGLSKLAGVDLANETVTVGTYPETSKSAIRSLIGAGTPLDVQVNETSIVNSGIANIPVASSSTLGVIKTNANYGTAMRDSPNQDTLMVAPAGEQNIKEGTQGYQPITPNRQHISIYYGLSKLAGIDLKNENVTVGTYPETSKTAIRSLIGAAAVSDIPSVPVQDVQVAGTSVLSNGIANVPVASNIVSGVVKTTTTYGTAVSDGFIYLVRAISSQIKDGTAYYNPIVPKLQHESVFYGLAKVAGADEKNSTLSVGTYTETAKSAIRNMLGATSSNVIAVQDEQPTDTDTKVWLPETQAAGVQVPTMEDMVNYVQKTDYATSNTAGIVKINVNYGLAMDASNNIITNPPSDTQIKEASSSYRPLTPNLQHKSVFYGLAKAAGDTTQASSSNAVGTYTDDAKSAIQTMLGVPGDVQVNGTSVVSNGVANIPIASTSAPGALKVGGDYCGLQLDSSGYLKVAPASSSSIKLASSSNTYCIYRPITPYVQHEATFYGLAKAAGDTTQSASSNAVGTYTTEAKAAIHTMLGIDPASIAAQVDIPLVETVSGTTPTITGQPNVRYVCGEVSTISITPPASGSVDVIFESGSTATVMTVPSTVKWPAWFDAETLETNTTYEVLITDGVYGSVMTWAT